MSRAVAGRAARRLALATAVSALALLVAGALVNAQQAALSVPDWPTSYGRWLLTAWPGNTAYEQVHRVLAALTTLLAVASWWALRRRAAGTAGERLAAWTLFWIALQVLLGGVVVLARTPPAVSAVHVLLALGVACLACLAAGAVAGVGAAPSAPAWPRRTLAWGLAMVAGQVVLGASSRHPPLGQAPFVATLLVHAVNGLALAIVLPVLGVKLLRRRHAPATARLGGLLFAVALAQAVIGAWAFVIAPEPFAETWPPPPGFPWAHALHVALAAALMTILVALRGLAPPADSAVAQAAEPRSRHKRTR